MLKKLNRFNLFDMDAFLGGKRLMLVEKKDWVDFESRNILGEKLEAVIVEDNTDYGEENVTNQYEKLTFKVPHKVNIPLKAEIKAVGAKGTIWGDFRNQLSIICDDVVAVPKK